MSNYSTKATTAAKIYIILLIGILTATTLSAQLSFTGSPTLSKLEGDCKFEVYKQEVDKQILDDLAALSNTKPFNEELMYSSLLNAYTHYLLADSLYRENEKQGIDESENLKNIADKLTESRGYFLSGGLYYYQQNNVTKASLCFEIYANYRRLEIFTDKRIPPLDKSDYEPVAEYYAAITAAYANNHDKTIQLLEKIRENYTPNDTYKESDIYELLAFQYKQINNDNLYRTTLENGYKKFPSNEYLLTALINADIESKQYDSVLQYIDTYIALYPERTCEMISTVGTLMTHIPKYDKAEEYYKTALKKDKECLTAIKGLGVLNILIAQQISDNQNTEKLSKRKLRKANKKLIPHYKKALPYLNEYYNLAIKNNMDKQKQREALNYLQNAYSNLNNLGVNAKKELEEVKSKISLLELN